MFLGGINDNNGEQLIQRQGCGARAERRRREAGCSRRVHWLPERAEAGRGAGDVHLVRWSARVELIKAGGAGAKFVTDFKAKYGHDPASAYAIYGAAATQYIMAAIAASDGTRKGVRDAAFSGTITIPADQSVIGKDFSIDKDSGDVTVRDMSIQLMKDNIETFLKAWPLD